MTFWLFKLSSFSTLDKYKNKRVILNTFYSSYAIRLKLCIDVTDILKLCLCFLTRKKVISSLKKKKTVISSLKMYSLVGNIKMTYGSIS